MTSAKTVMLGPQDIDRMVELEVASFDPTIQASRETILKRMSLGHLMFGLEENGVLAAAVCCSYSRFDPQDQTSFVKSEDDFGLQPQTADFNAQFIYSRGVHPAFQSRGYSKVLVAAAMARARADGCKYVVGNPRTAAYAGSPSEGIERQPRFRAAIDRFLAGGRFPTMEELLTDQSLFYFSHLPGCRFHWIIPGFAPHDTASGGIRLIVYVSLPAT